jgi:hypothetical protein
MLTLGRFKAMAESYGADLQRWPEEVRGEAEALLTGSPQARAVLDQARALDTAIEAAGARADAAFWRLGEQDAALVRLRSRVAARIAASAGYRPPRQQMSSARGQGGLWLQLGWLGMATGSGVAIAAGLLIGAMYASAPEPDSVLTMLQAAPIHILAD